MDRSEPQSLSIPMPNRPRLTISLAFRPSLRIHAADCIDLGFLLDNSRVETLRNPAKHSFHWLLDVGLCYGSGFAVLSDKDPTTGRHDIAYRLDDADAVLAAGRAAGRRGPCSTCTGGGTSPERGFQARVQGTLLDMGDGSGGFKGAPLLGNVTVVDVTGDDAASSS
ncbi:hypothetical protein ACHAWF_006695, partial [Thalassiosira exigua]